MRNSRIRRYLPCLLMLASLPCSAQDEGTGRIIGRWDMTVHTKSGDYPSWFEITESGSQFAGRFVGRVGSARPIKRIAIDGDRLDFSLPPQYEGRNDDLRFEGRLYGGKLEGTTKERDGTRVTWTAVRAPDLKRRGQPKWGEPVDLIAGPGLAGWRPRNPRGTNNWTIKDGILANSGGGSDLVTERQFTDFKLHAELRYPKDSNSGIYLRGRYEVQLQDDYNQKLSPDINGSIYGFITPASNPTKPAGEWQTYDITLVGRTVTVILNGVTIIDRKEIPGITGGALDSAEGSPGPVFIQGDHGPVEFRKLTIVPAK